MYGLSTELAKAAAAVLLIGRLAAVAGARKSHLRTEPAQVTIFYEQLSEVHTYSVS